MKKINSVIVFLFFTLSLTAQKPGEKDKQAIKDLITQSFDEIFSNSSAAEMDKFYTKDFILLEHGVVWNRDSIAKSCEETKKQEAGEKNISKRINTIDVIDLKISKDMAWIAYQNHAVWKREAIINGRANWLESATAIRTKDGWRLQMLHSTYIETK